MNKTTCCSYFVVCSAGEMQDRIGFVASKNSGFDPRYITEKLKIEPFQAATMNEFRNKGSGAYPFSKWMGCRQDEPPLDAEGQCLKIVRQLRPLIPQLCDIKKEYNVDYSIIIVPHIYNAEKPILAFNAEIIEFCYNTGTEIDVDMYICDKE